MADPYTPESFVTEFWSGVSGHDIPDEQQDRLEATVKALAETQKLLREANASGLSDMIVQRNRAVERAERAEADNVGPEVVAEVRDFLRFVSEQRNDPKSRKGKRWDILSDVLCALADEAKTHLAKLPKGGAT